VDEFPLLDPERLRRDHPVAFVEVVDLRFGCRPAGAEFDTVIDATRRTEGRGELFERTFPRVAPGGTFFVLDHREPGSEQAGPVTEDRLWPRLLGSGLSGQSERHVRRVVLDEQHLYVQRGEGRREGAGAASSRLPGLVRRVVQVEQPRVAVIGGDRADRVVAEIRQALPRAEVIGVRPTAPRHRRHARLAAHAPLDLMVDATGGGEDSANLLRWGFLHLRSGGSLVVLDGSPLGRRSVGSDALWEALRSVVSRRCVEAAYERTKELEWNGLAAAIGRVDVGPRHLVLTNRVSAVALLRDRELRGVARRRRDPGIRVHVSERRAPFTSRAVLGESTVREPTRMPETYEVPALHVHEYRDVTCLPKQLVVKGNLVLPDSFRHPGYLWLTNRSLRPMTRLFGEAVPTPSRRLEGSYFHLDGEVRHHFGHVMTEHLSRLWAWPEAKAADPDLRALVSSGPLHPELAEWQVALYEAAGVAREDIVTIREPVVVDRLVAATPMFSMPTYAHPGIAEVWDRIAAALEPQAEGIDVPERIFVTRGPGLKRWCHETAELERILGRHGYAAILPERLPISHQVLLFRRAKAIAGFAGSGMFPLMFAAEPKPVLLIRSTGYRASNEYLISSVRGHRLETLTGRPDAARAEGPRRAWPTDRENRDLAARSAFHVDLEADREQLEEMLRRMG
jgi:capsular polysaccharide biosynthesis protein